MSKNNSVENPHNNLTAPKVIIRVLLFFVLTLVSIILKEVPNYNFLSLIKAAEIILIAYCFFSIYQSARYLLMHSLSQTHTEHEAQLIKAHAIVAGLTLYSLAYLIGLLG